MYDEGRLVQLVYFLMRLTMNYFYMHQSHSGRLHSPCKRETRVPVRSNRTWCSTGILPRLPPPMAERRRTPVSRRIAIAKVLRGAYPIKPLWLGHKLGK